MAKVWKYLLVVAAVLVIAGALLGGTGLITGASLQRVSAGLDGPDGLWQSAGELARRLRELLPF